MGGFVLWSKTLPGVCVRVHACVFSFKLDIVTLEHAGARDPQDD